MVPVDLGIGGPEPHTGTSDRGGRRAPWPSIARSAGITSPPKSGTRTERELDALRAAEVNPAVAVRPIPPPAGAARAARGEAQAACVERRHLLRPALDDDGSGDLERERAGRRESRPTTDAGPDSVRVAALTPGTGIDPAPANVNVMRKPLPERASAQVSVVPAGSRAPSAPGRLASAASGLPIRRAGILQRRKQVMRVVADHDPGRPAALGDDPRQVHDQGPKKPANLSESTFMSSTPRIAHEMSSGFSPREGLAMPAFVGLCGRRRPGLMMRTGPSVSGCPVLRYFGTADASDQRMPRADGRRGLFTPPAPAPRSPGHGHHDERAIGGIHAHALAVAERTAVRIFSPSGSSISLDHRFSGRAPYSGS